MTVGQEVPVREGPSFREALGVWARIGLLSFGGPAAQIALMHRMLVDEKRWLDEGRFLNALSFCMLLPGPEAMQLATYAGWRLHGIAGGLAAGLLFVLPGALVVLFLSMLYVALGDVPVVEGLFLGVKAAVLAIVVEALGRIARRALVGGLQLSIAAAAFVAIFLFNTPFPMIVVVAALAGFLTPGALTGKRATGADADVARLAAGHVGASLRTAVVWLAIWLLPLIVLEWGSAGGLLADLGWYFSKLAVVTFGGAYAVLAYMTQEVVAVRGWLTTGQMMDGLGLAETTPGPLILVTEFVAFVAAAGREGNLWLGAAGAVIALWATFAPCFLWIFVGAPYVEWLNGQPRLKGALAAITAAVVGVIANLAIWFALHVIFRSIVPVEVGPVRFGVPELSSIDPLAGGLALICGVLLLALHRSVPEVLAVAVALAAGATLAGF
ncbi:MAG: chromate efflux transporter [Rhizobiales bacterium]|nr:chromate efflux transporter [Hyphomicrobiales bacterium]